MCGGGPEEMMEAYEAFEGGTGLCDYVMLIFRRGPSAKVVELTFAVAAAFDSFTYNTS